MAALARAARVGLGVIATLDASFGVFGVFGVAAAFLVRFFVASSSPSSPASAFEYTNPNGARAGVRRRRVDVPGVARGAVSGSGDARLRLLDGVFAADLGAEDFGAEDFGAEDFGADAATGVRLGLGSVVVASSSSAAAAAAAPAAFSARRASASLFARLSLRRYVSASALASSIFLSAAASAFSAAARLLRRGSRLLRRLGGILRLDARGDERRGHRVIHA